MRNLRQVLHNLHYLGLLGLVSFVSPWPGWNWFWLFWLLFLVPRPKVPGGGVGEAQQGSAAILWQSLRQLVGIPFIYLTHGFRLPHPGRGVPDAIFRLPFKGEWAILNGGAGRVLSHSWGVPTQRYAYDFVVLNAAANTFEGDAMQPQNYLCYGRGVVAAAPGTVVKAVDRWPDSAIQPDGGADENVGDIRGNYVVVRHAKRLYSVYCHLQPGSVAVRPGQPVEAGGLLGKCGNSGHSSEPHLHFHLQDGKSFYASAGLPVVFAGARRRPIPGYGGIDLRPTDETADGRFVHRGEFVCEAEADTVQN